MLTFVALWQSASLARETQAEVAQLRVDAAVLREQVARLEDLLALPQ